ncbi:SpoIIE family protein phosphatase [Streptomyces collinus]|uniref:SpoIIE family protein phosphatase n=1 Tax=Streptomyces collinus TaxID=42684 RepID=UPI002942F61E|nr:SpoIIE family protein phosphatase [Streptomyces collinus]
MAVTVTDVDGHGLLAADVIGQLRGALTAASLVAEGPARALEVRGLYARTIDGVENITVSTAFIDQGRGTITYGSAGPPACVLADGWNRRVLGPGPR